MVATIWQPATSPPCASYGGPALAGRRQLDMTTWQLTVGPLKHHHCCATIFLIYKNISQF